MQNGQLDSRKNGHRPAPSLGGRRSDENQRSVFKLLLSNDNTIRNTIYLCGCERAFVNIKVKSSYLNWAKALQASCSKGPPEQKLFDIKAERDYHRHRTKLFLDHMCNPIHELLPFLGFSA